jgi:protein-disulfide isomerase
VKIVFKHQPLGFHQYAYDAAMASLAAKEQGKFWEMHDKMFENQKALDRASLDRYAEEIGLNMKKYKAAMDSKKFDAQIKADQALAAKVGATGTPISFVNGIAVKGAQPFEKFKAVIEQELEKAKAKR